MILADLLIPTASQCVRVAWPLVLFGVALWFWRNGDTVIERLFPHWRWEKELGWLNIKGNRQAESILRGFTHLLHLGLLVALAAILFFSWTFGQPHDTDDKLILITLFVEWFYMFACYGVWIYYLAVVLYPRIRDEFDAEELDRYRIEHPDLEEAKIAADRLKISLWESKRPRRF